MRKLSLLLLAGVLLTGCAGLDTLRDAYEGIGEYFGGKDNAEPPRELADEFENKLKLSVLWDATVGKGYDGQYLNLVPAADESAVYAADRRGEIQARNRLSGDKLWSVETELAISAGPVVDGGKLLVGSSNAEVAAYNTADGALLWKTTVSSEILALPRIGRGVVVVRGSDGHLIGLDENNGATLWTYERGTPALSVRSLGSPLVVEDLVIDGYASGKLVALNVKDGKLAWEATVALPHGRSEIERLVDVDSVPVVRGDTLYVSGYQGGVAAVSLKDGEVLWRQEKISSYSGLAASRRQLFLSDASSDVWQLDMRDGGDLWKQDELHQRKLTAPVLVKNYAVVGDFEGYLHVLSQDDGSLQARLQVDDSAIREAPVVYDDVLYVYSADGKLSAVSVE
ncbi:outer membrane protein assembly factor BamB [Methylococcus sp. EFPC2]|uniref:outer membrane protein assembly factor BamB n=1 Tax=Methylococcus sp. EFPC2 TaxID=2812648 RepID=UPI001967081E|nr:outer membrane protein assembly factor BamB [Methylococcus sp. EFPC2]QSA96965.1 outer membrane protein assembly factor BamB [Methylococcus sp. EFPC2]